MPKRTDANQAEIVRALRDAGCTVVDLHKVGRGCPDILVGIHGRNVLMEIKTATGRLTVDEINFHGMWEGQYDIVRSVEEAFAVINKLEEMPY